jgi:excisionase family DNA binding protein
METWTLAHPPDDELGDVVQGWLTGGLPADKDEQPTGRQTAVPGSAGRLLNVNQAADYVGVHRNTVYEAVKRGRLVARRVGRLVRFTIEDLDAWTKQP